MPIPRVIVGGLLLPLNDGSLYIDEIVPVFFCVRDFLAADEEGLACDFDELCGLGSGLLARVVVVVVALGSSDEHPIVNKHAVATIAQIFKELSIK